MIRFRVLGWGNGLGPARWGQCLHKGPHKKETGGSESGKDFKMLPAMKEQEGAMSQRTQAESKETVSPRASRGNG